MGILEGKSGFVEVVAHASLHTAFSHSVWRQKEYLSFLAAVPPQHCVFCREAVLRVAMFLGEDFPPARNQTLEWLNLK